MTSAPWFQPVVSVLVFGGLFVSFVVWRIRHAAPAKPDAPPKPSAPPDLESIQASLDRIEQRLDAIERALEVKQEAV